MITGQLRQVLAPSRSQINTSRSCCVPRSARGQASKVSASAKASQAPAEAVVSRRDALIAGRHDVFVSNTTSLSERVGWKIPSCCMQLGLLLVCLSLLVHTLQMLDSKQSKSQTYRCSRRHPNCSFWWYASPAYGSLGLVNAAALVERGLRGRKELSLSSKRT